MALKSGMVVACGVNTHRLVRSSWLDSADRAVGAIVICKGKFGLVGRSCGSGLVFRLVFALVFPYFITITVTIITTELLGNRTATGKSTSPSLTVGVVLSSLF